MTITRAPSSPGWDSPGLPTVGADGRVLFCGTREGRSILCAGSVSPRLEIWRIANKAPQKIHLDGDSIES